MEVEQEGKSQQISAWKRESGAMMPRENSFKKSESIFLMLLEVK